MIGYKAHQWRKYRTTNNAHYNKGRSLLRMRPQVFKAQTKNGWEHNAEEEI